MKRIPRAVLFGVTAVTFLAYWLIADPSYNATARQGQWPYLLWFSASILTLGIAVAMFGRMVGGRWVIRLSLLACAGAVLGACANVIEDGLDMEWAFFAFVLGSALQLSGLVGMTITIAAKEYGARRLLSLIPAATAAGIIAFVAVGGPVLMVTWVAAAIVALMLPDNSTEATH